MTHPIPEAALDKHVALLGMTGAGKTSVIKTAIVEPDLEADRRVLIVTPKDDWWGLRLSRTGKSTGFDIPIFGGRHEDYPLQVKDAGLLAETYGTMKGSAIFCTSRLSVQDRARWFAAFAERILATNRGWVRVVIDEAHVFMPKQGGKGGGAIPMALHAGNELVSQGRSGGLRIVLASQRSAKLHNDALTQCSCLMAMLLMAPHDRDAVKDWIEDQADPQTGKEIIASLATLNPGQAWVWAPGAKFLERVQFSRPSTFDSSAAPDDDTASDLKLKPINLDSLKGKLAAVEAEVAANDPARLKAEVAKLKRELAAKPEAPSADTAAVEDAHKRGYSIGHADAKRQYENAIAIFMQQWQVLGPKLERVQIEVEVLRHFKVGAPPAPISRLPRVLEQRIQKAVDLKPSGDLTRPQRRVVNSLIFWKSIGHNAPSREQVAAVAGYVPGSGNFNNLIGGLRTDNHVDIPQPGRVALSNGAADESMTPDEAREMMLSVLNGPQRKLVSAVQPGESVSREELGTRTDYAAGSGNFNNLVGSLCTLDIFHKPSQGHLALSDWAQELLS